MSLIAAITGAAGQPVTTRVGIVVSSSPLIVDVQGTLIQSPNLGKIGSTIAPSVGDTVLLLGQSVRGSKSSGSSWICLGSIFPA